MGTPTFFHKTKPNHMPYNANREIAHKESEIDIANFYINDIEKKDPSSKWTMEDLPHSYIVDRMVLKNGTRHHYVEIKNRNHLPTTYDTLFISDRKYLWCNLYKKFHKVPVVILVRYADNSVWCHKVRKNNYDVRFIRTKRLGGNTDNTMDHEPMISIPIKDFVKMGGA